jgi:hypothetical protein
MEQPPPQHHHQQQQQGSSSLSTQEPEEEEPKEEEKEKCKLLLLFLGLPQSGGDDNTATTGSARRLDGAHWDFLTLRDLQNCRCASKSIYSQLQFVEYTRCRDYLVPFPGYPGLLSTPNDINTTRFICTSIGEFAGHARGREFITTFWSIARWNFG